MHGIECEPRAEEILGGNRAVCEYSSAIRGAAVAVVDTHATMNELYDAYARGDFDRMATLVDEDIDWLIYAPVMVFPMAGPRRGRAAVMQTFREIAQAYVMESYQREIVVVEGDRVAVMADVRMRQRTTRTRPAFPGRQFHALQKRPAGRIPRVHQFLRRGRAGARARTAGLSFVRSRFRTANRFPFRLETLWRASACRKRRSPLMGSACLPHPSPTS